MGGSTSYVTVVSQWVVTKKLQDMFPYLESKRCGLGNWWQVIELLLDFRRTTKRFLDISRRKTLFLDIT